MNKKLRALLIFLLLIAITTNFYSPMASASGEGTAYLSSFSGEVSITPAGGAKSIPAYRNMKLAQGDQIITGDNGSVSLKISQPESQRTLGPNSRATISSLLQNTSRNKFSIKLWTGSMWSSVASVKGADEDIVETPGARISVKGTNFLVHVESDGTVSVFVASGLVASTFTNSSSAAPILIGPTQQLSVNPGALPQKLMNALAVVDVSDVAGQMAPAILKAIIASAPAISAENQELVLQMQSSLEKNIQPAVQRDGILSDISIKTQEDLDAYSKNIYNLLSNIAFESIQSSKVNLSDMNQLITAANKQITDSEYSIRLTNIEPLNPLAGMDPAIAQDRAKEQARMEALRTQVRDKQLLLQSEFKARLSASLQQIIDRKHALDLANQSVLDELQSRAESLYTAQLSPEELAVFQKNKQQLTSDGTSAPNTPVTPVPTQPDSSSAAPEVTLVRTKTAQGFNLAIHLQRFTGPNAIYGTEFHFISDNSVEVIGSDSRFLNDSYFAPANSVDLVKTIIGTTGSPAAVQKETIYAATRFGTASNTEIPSGILATIPFSVSGSGTLKLFYVKIVDNTGKTILELKDTDAGLPSALTYTK